MESLETVHFQGIPFGETKSVLEQTFEEFERENSIFVQSGKEEDAERAAFEESRKQAIQNNANPNSTHKETLYPGISELTDDEFKKTHLGLKDLELIM